MRVPRYLRIQGRELAYRTQKPVGIFVLNDRRARDGVYSQADEALYQETRRWFVENLMEPPFYGTDNDDPDGSITWFKTAQCGEMLEHIQPLIELLDRYGVPYDVVLTDHPGKIVYEDEWQVGTI